MTTECYDKFCKQRYGKSDKEIVYIKWSDASFQTDNFMGISSLMPEFIIENVGFLIQENETHYSMGMEYHKESNTWRRIIHIPKGMVIEIKIISSFDIEVK